MSKIVRLKYDDPHQEVGIGTTREGFLQCSVCRNTEWCQHTEKIVSGHMDAEMIWDKDNLGALPEEQIVQVPVVMAYGQHAEMYLKLNTKLGCYKVLFCPFWKTKDPDEHDTFLGFLNPGEGRYVLRSMLVEHLRTLSEGDCPNVNHGFEAQMKLEKHLTESESQKIAEAFSILNKNRCITCSMGTSDNFDDLIPDPGTGARSPWRS